MKILSLGTDRKLFDENSAVRQRVIEYGNLVDELKIIIFSSSTKESRITNHESRISGSNVWLYPTNSKNKFFYVFDAIKIGKKIIKKDRRLNPPNYKNDWLITTQDPFETGLAGWFIAKTLKTKLQFQIHTDFMSAGFKMSSILNSFRVKIAMFLIPQADGIRVVSERIKKSLQTKNYKLQTNISVLPIFVDFNLLEVESNFDLHRKYSQFDFIILMVSRFEKEKNIPLAISIMKKIVKNYPKVGLVIVGDGSLRRSLQKTVSRLQLEKNIIFEMWKDGNLVSYYKTADLFLSTSNFEGYGMTLIESALSGCPILTTDVGLVGDVLKEGSVEVCGIGDKKCFVKKLEKLLNSREELNVLVQKAKEDLENRRIKSKQEYLEEFKKGWQNCFN